MVGAQIHTQTLRVHCGRTIDTLKFHMQTLWAPCGRSIDSHANPVGYIHMQTLWSYSHYWWSRSGDCGSRKEVAGPTIHVHLRVGALWQDLVVT